MWSKVKLEDVAEKIAMGPFGSNLKVETFANKGVPIISGAHLRGTRVVDAGNNFITESHAQKLLNSNVFQGDVIFTHAGNIGQVAFIPETSKYEKYVISQRQFYLRCNQNKLRPAFITYYFHTYKGRHQLLANTSQVGVPSIARPSSYLKSLQVPLPPLEVQDAIVDLLSVLDDKIENNLRMNETLEAMARAIFKSWFVDFDPVRAKMEGRHTELPDDISDLFPNELVDSEIGQIPKGWKNITVGDLIVPKRGKTITKNKTIEGVIPVVAGGLEPAYFHSQSNVDAPVITISASGANAGFTRLYNENIWASDCSYISRKQTDTPYFWYVFLKTHQKQIYHMQQGAAQPHIYPSDLMRLELCVPLDEKLIQYFERLALPYFQRISIAQQESKTLAELRDTLLPKLISGEIRVANAERKMETAI